MKHDHEAQLQALMERVESLEAEREIRELLAQYGHTADTCQDEAYVDLFTEDAEIDLSFDGTVKGDDFRYLGRDEIRRFISKPNEHHRPGFYGRSMHLMGPNLRVHVTGDTATAESYNMTFQKTDVGVTIVAAGNNFWRFRKEEGRWRITLRRRREMGGAGYVRNVGRGELFTR